MNTKRLARFLPVAGAVAVVLVGVGCSDDNDPAVVGSAPGEEPADTTAPPDDGQETTEKSTEPAEAGDDEDTGGGSLGTSTGQHGGRDDILVPLRIEVTSLQRNGELVELTMTLTNEDEDAEYTPYTEYRDPELATATETRSDISGIKLIDQGERLAYLPVLDSGENCLCSNNLVDVNIAAGESYQLHASFGGIPEDVTTLDLDVPGFSPIAGLEVQG